MQKVVITGGSGFIGTNLLDRLSSQGYQVVNFDIVAPREDAQSAFWNKVSILDYVSLEKALLDFIPDFIIHLAATTDLDGTDEAYYRVNTEGTANLMQAAAKIPALRRVIFTSSMYVCQPGYIPQHYDDYKPHTPYGKSKVVGEQLIKQAIAPHYTWLIVRPTSIWGPWFGIPYIDFFRVIYQGKYLDFGKTCTKTYGYVENTVYQLQKLLEAPDSSVKGKTFYLGDTPPIPIAEWAEEIAAAMGKDKIRKVPFLFIRLAALVGDTLAKLGVNFPMTSFRLTNMQTDNILPLDNLDEITGPIPVNRITGVGRTLTWLQSHKGYKLGPSSVR